MQSDLTPELLLRAYASGIFPMAEGRDDPELFWVNPELRGVFDIGALHISRSLRRRIHRGDFSVSFNTHFSDVIAACADREETWINDELFTLYQILHTAGYAHSVEIKQNDRLIGGVFGIAIGSAFFGESMFSKATDGSKLALVYLMERLQQGKFTLFDTQFLTPHLASLGAYEISREAYKERLEKAINQTANFAASDDVAPTT